MREAVLRFLNELPSLVILGLVVAGVDQADYQPLIELAGAAAAFGTWLLVRHRTDGPVTALRGFTADQKVLGNLHDQVGRHTSDG